MNYILALFLPPLSILFAGLTHPMFILLAWILIYQGGEERRVRRLTDRREG